MNAAEIAGALGNATKEGREWRCNCPLHGGTAFTIRDGENGVIWTCWAKCNPVAIAAELHRRELLPNDEKTTAARPRPRNDDASRLEIARWMWGKRTRLPGTLAERYLRETRACRGPFPPTLGFLPSTERHPPALIAAYGLPAEPEPGVLLPLEAVRGVQLIRLTDDARKLDKPITIGRCLGIPIVLAPLNDGLGLAIAEGVEDALSVAEATGLGAWAAGGASRLAALAGAVPPYADAISLLEDDDPAGRKGVADLEAALLVRGLWRRDQIERVALT